MTDYDPNLPQEFAHMPKRRGLGVVTLTLAVIAVFVVSALVAMLAKHAPAPTAGGPESTALRPPPTPAYRHRKSEFGGCHALTLDPGSARV